MTACAVSYTASAPFAPAGPTGPPEPKTVPFAVTDPANVASPFVFMKATTSSLAFLNSTKLGVAP